MDIDHSWTAFDAEHVCYVIQPTTGGPFKVGNARCLSKRLRSIQNGNPRLLIARALFSGGDDTERHLHAILHDYRAMGEWFDEGAMPLLCDFIRRDPRLLWGTPWTEDVYREPSPTNAEMRAEFRALMMDPDALAAVRSVLRSTSHPAYRDALMIVNKYGAEVGNGG